MFKEHTFFGVLLFYSSDSGIIKCHFMPVSKGAMSMLLQELRDQVVYYGRQMLQSGLTMHTGGNLSVRDRESGLIVINAGREAEIQVGMPMQITRGDQIIARAIVTDVRKKVAGLLVQKQVSNNLVVNVGDRVSVTTND